MDEKQSHDIFRQVGYIQQALSQNKKPIGFFIGAGCPLSVRVNHREEKGKNLSDPLIQDVAGLTATISASLKSTEKGKQSSWDQIIGLMKEDGNENPNIEDILTQVRALRNVAGKGTVRGFVEKDLDELDESICKIISDEVNKSLPDGTSPYHNLAIWTRTLERDRPVHIFTTNYDLLIEQAFEEAAAPYFDGFVGTRKAFFDLGAVEDEHLLPPRWTRLWKIHGSINWRLDSQNNVIRSDNLGEGNRYLIYPSHLKYDQSRKMPYLAMLDRLKDFVLKSSSIIFISGYSFADEHINDVLCRSLSSNATGMAYAFIFGNMNDDKYKKARECALRTPNLSLIAFDGAIIGRSESSWSFNEDTRTNIPDGIIIPPSEDSSGKAQACELRLGDFLQFSNLLKGLSGINEIDEE